MNYCIDFEATQFSERIISIGCVAETGEVFTTLVRPERAKDITKFITALTGITKEMILTAPTADAAFIAFQKFVRSTSDDKANHFYCYGDSDKHFLTKTASHMHSPKAIAFVNYIINNLTDYATTVKEFFHADQTFSLLKVYILIKKEMSAQKHDALEDAIMLQTIMDSLEECCSPEDKDALAQIQTPNKPFPARKKAPDFYLDWTHITNKWEANTYADETNWMVKCSFEDGNIKYFDSLERASYWLIRYFALPGMSPKREQDVKKIMKVIERGKPRDENGTPKKRPYDLTWEFR